MWFFGVLLPSATFGIEIWTRLCASEWFDPMPTPIHVAAVALVPVMNALVLVRLGRRDGPPPAWMRWGHGLSVAVAAVYTLIFLPTVPIGVLALVFVGAGLLPLSPLLALVAGLILVWRIRRRVPRMRGEWLVWIAGPALILGPLVPAMFGHYWIRQAVTGTPEVRRVAVERMRWFGDRKDLLRLANGHRSVLTLPLTLRDPCDAGFAQSLYFQVTGRAFNTVPVPARHQGRVLGIFAGDRDPDLALGGEAVAGTVAGLSLEKSSMEAISDVGDGWGYSEWTFEFRNQHPREHREARAILQLPPGGVVSRVTLWVNGEEREAAFADRGVARAAYQEVAVQQQRDPILVTTAGPDRVLMQCFPVPVGGGRMKVRIGVTAPLDVPGPATRRFLWPRIVEKNFGMSREFSLPARLTVTGGAVEGSAGDWSPDPAHPGRWTGTLAATRSEGARSEVRLRLDAGTEPGWALDDRGERPAWIRPRLEPVPSGLRGPLAVVLDGGVGMEESVPAVQRALGSFRDLPGGEELWVARDGVRQWTVPAGGWVDALSSWSGSLVGGQDCQPALEAAVDALAATGGTILWIHGPQPAEFEPAEGLRAVLERAGQGVVVVDAAVSDAPNAIAGRMDGLAQFQTLPRRGSLEEDLDTFLARWTGRAPELGWTWERTETAPGVTATGSAHVARLWALGDVRRALREGRSDDARRLAARWHLVTPVTGAVVLETREQYERNGLKPVDPHLAPTAVPEPETWALLAAGLAAMVLLGGHRRRGTNRGVEAGLDTKRRRTLPGED